MDAITTLRDQHHEVERMFKTLQKGDLTVVPDICEALTMHSELEEQVFYPSIREEVPEVDQIVLESLEEHALVKQLVVELQGMSEDDESYQAKATVLMEMTRHHVEEEEQDLFPKVRDKVGRKRLQELGESMAAMAS